MLEETALSRAISTLGHGEEDDLLESFVEREHRETIFNSPRDSPSLIVGGRETTADEYLQNNRAEIFESYRIPDNSQSVRRATFRDPQSIRPVNIQSFEPSRGVESQQVRGALEMVRRDVISSPRPSLRTRSPRINTERASPRLILNQRDSSIRSRVSNNSGTDAHHAHHAHHTHHAPPYHHHHYYAPPYHHHAHHAPPYHHHHYYAPPPYHHHHYYAPPPYHHHEAPEALPKEKSNVCQKCSKQKIEKFDVVPRPAFNVIGDEKKLRLMTEYVEKIEKVRTENPELSISEIPAEISVEEAYERYETVVRHILILSEVNRYETWISVISVIIQIAVTKYVDEGFGDFIAKQMRVMKNYRSTLYRIGEKNIRPGFSSSNPEMKIFMAYAGSTVLYCGMRFLANYITTAGASILENKLTSFFFEGQDYSIPGYNAPNLDPQNIFVPEPPPLTGNGTDLVQTAAGAANIFMSRANNLAHFYLNRHN